MGRESPIPNSRLFFDRVCYLSPNAGSIGLSEKDAIAKYGTENIKVYSQIHKMYLAMTERRNRALS
jgi:glutathione reductase (NADPH)